MRFLIQTKTCLNTKPTDFNGNIFKSIMIRHNVSLTREKGNTGHLIGFQLLEMNENFFSVASFHNVNFRMSVKIKENSKNVATVKQSIALILCQFEGLGK